MTPSILIVEDELIVSMEIEERLTAMGYHIAGSADTGEQAIDLANRHRPDLVLMDIRLRGEMDGITAAEEIHRRFRLPVIFLTAYSEDSTLERAKLAGPYGYILKPFDDRELKSAVEIAIYRHTTEEELRRVNLLYDVLSQVNQAVVRTSSRDELLRTVCRLLVERGTVDLAWIGQFDPVYPSVKVVSLFGNGSNASQGSLTEVNLGHGAWQRTGSRIREGRRSVCNDCTDSQCPYHSGGLPPRQRFKSWGSFPIRFQGHIWGMFSVASSKTGFLRERAVGLLEEVAMEVSYALDTMEGETRRKQAEASLRESEQRFRDT